MKRAIVVGSAGQDGSYLSELLEKRGYRVVGLRRGAGTPSAVDIADKLAVTDLVRTFKPAEIYYLAAHHHSSEEAVPSTGELLARSFTVHVTYLIGFLDAMVVGAPEARLFYASSSHVFGSTECSPQTELTPFAPVSPYGISKAAGTEVCRYYRKHHGLHCSVGILFNHESPRRRPHFVSQKIVRGAIALRDGHLPRLVLGNLDAIVDWGYAPDYVEAMTAILALPTADDFVIATGTARRVRDFVGAAFSALGIDAWDRVSEDSTLVRKLEQHHPLIGDSAKLTAKTGWRPRHDLQDIASVMVAAALDRHEVSV